MLQVTWRGMARYGADTIRTITGETMTETFRVVRETDEHAAEQHRQRVAADLLRAAGYIEQPDGSYVLEDSTE